MKWGCGSRTFGGLLCTLSSAQLSADLDLGLLFKNNRERIAFPALLPSWSRPRLLFQLSSDHSCGSTSTHLNQSGNQTQNQSTSWKGKQCKKEIKTEIWDKVKTFDGELAAADVRSRNLSGSVRPRRPHRPLGRPTRAAGKQFWKPAFQPTHWLPGPMEPNAFQRNGCQCWTDGLVKRKLF